ncbi:hypothetical protein C8F04DRAFT_975950 [Mycena alexandri]|uniref:Uncharacterized protein n=1 Tax=Mycena alexandri TaxID=1745969 RepID=A0AAD6S1T7_9AGAR|nr:hypothetical protein C8F04DRAFT_975950 [Mycena alexandri]
MALLRQTRSIVSGSAALLMVSELEFVPGDLDVYTPLSQEEAALAIVQGSMGFDKVSSWMPHGYCSNAAICKVHRLAKARKSINLIIVQGEDPAAAVFHFHSTIVMNYLSGFGLYCAYPGLTLLDAGVMNLPVVLRDVRARGSAEECYEKYRDRGVTMVNDVKKLSGHGRHDCRRDAECPHTVRSTVDELGLYVELLQPTDAEEEYLARHRYATIWMLGGPMCGARGTYFGNFVASLKASEITVSKQSEPGVSTDPT